MVNALITSKSAFASSGAAAVEFDSSASAGGNFVARRRREEDATHDVTIDGSAQSPVILGAEKDVAPVLRRTRYRRVVDGVSAAEGLLSQNPTQGIIDQSAAFWSREIDLALIAVINGLFDPTSGILKTTHKRSVAVGSGAAVPISFSDIVRAAGLIGDAGTDLAAVAMHSRQYADLCLEVGAKPSFLPIGPSPVTIAA